MGYNITAFIGRRQTNFLILVRGFFFDFHAAEYFGQRPANGEVTGDRRVRAKRRHEVFKRRAFAEGQGRYSGRSTICVLYAVFALLH